MTETQKVIAQMLRENTGSHFLDSGGAYGRNWERNQKRRFAKEPAVRLDVSAHKGTRENGEKYEYVELSPVISVFRFLSEAVEYAPHEDQEFQTFLKLPKNVDSNWLELMEEYGGAPAFNTYNGEDWLSQVLQGVWIGDGDAGIVLLQIHGGCDVRGDYTRPRAFRWSSDWSPCLYDNARASVFCKGERDRKGQRIAESVHGWMMKPGYSQGVSEEPKLDSFPAHVLDSGEAPVKGRLCGRNDVAYCPLCCAELEAGF